VRIRTATIEELLDDPEVCECGVPLATHPPLPKPGPMASSGKHPEVWSDAPFGTLTKGQRWTDERRQKASEYSRQRAHERAGLLGIGPRQAATPRVPE
jgi:hypothetical protein